jgi:diguanylate cyclase (GGDEF)-like protein
MAAGVRLRQTLAAQVEAATDPLAHLMACRVQTGVLDCMRVLDTLQSVLDRECRRAQQLELELAQTLQALADARAAATSRAASYMLQSMNLSQPLSRAELLELLGPPQPSGGPDEAAPALPERAVFCERLAQLLARHDTFELSPALLVLDLDAFRCINQKHGHALGDQVLRIVALRVGRAVRADDLVGRLGGDQFACAVFGAFGPEGLSHLACKLLDAVAAPIRVGPLQLAVRTSIGIAMFPSQGSSAQALIERADAAMFRAKRQRTGYGFATGAAHA